MVLAGTRGSVPRFEDDVSFAVPNVAWIAAVPRPDAAGTHGILQPLLDEVRRPAKSRGHNDALGRRPRGTPANPGASLW